MATTLELIISSETAVLSTGLNSLANNALVLSSAINNVQAGGGLGGYVLVRVKVIIAMASAAGSNTGVNVWFLKSSDAGTTFEAGGTAYVPLRMPDVVFPAPVDTTARTMSRDVLCPAGVFTVLIQNAATGQAFASSGSTLTLTAISIQSI